MDMTNKEIGPMSRLLRKREISRFRLRAALANFQSLLGSDETDILETCEKIVEYLDSRPINK